MTLVEFVAPHCVNTVLYNAGEIAGFDAETAEKLVADGVVKLVKVKSDK
jgi:hypothetical protein